MRDTLADVIRSGNAGLVLGAGASRESGAPLWSGLVDEMISRFPKAPVSTTMHPFEVAELIVETPQYSRAELVEFVKGRLDSLEPDNAYGQLPRIPWQAIFTTNYDDLVEVAYRTKARTQTLHTVHLEPDSLRISPRPGHLLFCHLMGSIRHRFESPASPVLTWGDFEKTRAARQSMLGMVQNVLYQGGKLIYVGYSFNDFLLLRVLEGVLEHLGTQASPYGFALMGADGRLEGAHLHRLQSRKVIPIAGDFDDLADLVAELADATVDSSDRERIDIPSPAKHRELKIRGTAVHLTEESASVLDELFTVLSEQEVSPQVPEPDADAARRFLEGEDLGWTPHSNGWVFLRPIYSEVLGYIKSLAAFDDPKRNEVILVHGPAGLGKSILARHLAYDLYTNAGLPVALARRSWIARPDLRIIDRFARDLREGGLDPHPLPPTIIVVDQAELLEYGFPYRAIRYLRSRGRPAIFVLFARTNEYFRGADDENSLRPSKDFLIPEKLDEAEISKLIAHIQALGVWEHEKVTTESFWARYIESEFQNSFFDTVYTLVEPTRQPLQDRIWSEFENLGELAQRSYTYVAAVHQFGLSLKLEMLRRVLDIDFPSFLRDVIQNDAREVLFSEHEAGNLNIHFRGRSRMISELVFQKVAPDNETQLEIFRAMIEATDPGEMFGNDELDIIRTLLVQVLGPKGYDRRFSPEEVAVLFRTAVATVEDDVLEHHCGLAERSAGNLLAAKEHLERSLALSSSLPLDYSVQRESPQHIQNSLATVCGQLALEALARGAEADSDQLYEEASRYFLEARSGSFPNAAAFDAHARMLMDRAAKRFGEGSSERALALGEALAVIDDGIDHVNRDYRPPLVELRAEILVRLGDLEEAIRELASRAEVGSKADRARYHVILGRMMIDRANPKGKHWSKALSHATTACELDPELFGGWKLRAKCYMQRHPDDFPTILEVLEKALKLPDGKDDIWSRYHAAVLHFEIENYKASREHFRMLNRVSRGHDRRVGIVEFAGTRDGSDPLEFTGRVVRMGPDRMGIDCEPLEAFSPIWFNPRTQRYYTPRQGDVVRFLVGFNYRGVLADDVERA